MMWFSWQLSFELEITWCCYLILGSMHRKQKKHINGVIFLHPQMTEVFCSTPAGACIFCLYHPLSAYCISSLSSVVTWNTLFFVILQKHLFCSPLCETWTLRQTSGCLPPHPQQPCSPVHVQTVREKLFELTSCRSRHTHLWHYICILLGIFLW